MSTTSPDAKLGLLARRMADTLHEEALALTGVRDALAAILSALRAGEADDLADRAESLQDFVHMAGERRAAHRRNMDLFFRVAGISGDSVSDVILHLGGVPEAADAVSALSEARSRIRTIAEESGKLVAASQYALGIAGQLNHELIMLLHGLMQPDGGRIYNAHGRTSAPRNRRSLIDRRG